MKTITLCLMGLLPCLASAANWQLMSVNTSGDRFYIDGDSITTVGKLKKAWTMGTYAQVSETDSYPKKKYWSAKRLQYFDCQQKTMAAFQVVLYAEIDGGGESVGSQSRKFDAGQLEDVIPDTSGESLLKGACSTAKYRAAQNKLLDQ